MVNFTKIFGLAGAALLFAGLANAQPSTCTAGTPSTNIIRGEGTTELIAPITFTCAGTGVGGTLSLQVFMSPALPITSKVLNSGTGATEAVAVVSGGGVLPAPSTNTYYGTVSGSTLNFSGIGTGSGAFTVTVSNIRVNATSVTVGTGVPPNISATAFASGSAGTITPVALTYSNIAFVQAGLGTSSLSKSFTTATATDPSAPAPGTFLFPNGAVASSGANSFVICNPYSAGGAPGDGGVGLGQQKSLAFAVTIRENFASAFKTAAGEASTVATVPSNAVLDGTRLAINFTNVPANVTLYVPAGLIYTTGAQAGANPPTQPTPAAIQLTASAAGTAFAAVTASTSGSDKNLGLAPVTLSSGSGTAVFEVVKQDLNNLDVYNVPVYVVSSANSVVGSSTPISVSVNFNPIGSTVIPNFAITSSTTTLTGSTFNLCTTSLLFPFVTNQLGFDTGLAIANTSTDPFGTSGATAQAGTCTLNFYGSGAPSPANVVTASVPSGTVYTQALSGVAAGFQGYLIAQCAFQYAHGFAFITDGVGSSGGLSQGYLAGVIPDVNQVARAANPLSLAGAGTGETLGN